MWAACNSRANSCADGAPDGDSDVRAVGLANRPPDHISQRDTDYISPYACADGGRRSQLSLADACADRSSNAVAHHGRADSGAQPLSNRHTEPSTECWPNTPPHPLAEPHAVNRCDGCSDSRTVVLPYNNNNNYNNYYYNLYRLQNRRTPL